jgi:DNA-binding NtrC family response regulator
MTNGTAIPNLLVTDCLGGSIPVDEFLNECRALNPNLRILMASGLNKRHMTLARDRKIRFIQKPFSPSEFIEAVQLVLAA